MEIIKPFVEVPEILETLVNSGIRIKTPNGQPSCLEIRRSNRTMDMFMCVIAPGDKTEIDYEVPKSESSESEGLGTIETSDVYFVGLRYATFHLYKKRDSVPVKEIETFRFQTIPFSNYICALEKSLKQLALKTPKS